MVEGQCRTVRAEAEKPGDPRSDRHLLRCFARSRDEEAFAVLVQRHGPAVWAVCRRVLGDTAEADDAFQATFLVLARKAAGEVWHDSVRGWLAAAAHRLALHIRAGEQRRRRRETAMGALPSSEEDWDSPTEAPLDDPLREVTRRELRRLLEAELDGLPEKYRAPMVLCYLEGKTNQEAARQLGWATGSISRRLARARALLRERPRLQSLAVAVGILGSVLMFALLLTPPKPEDRVARVMRQFRDPPQGGPGIESLLDRMESNGLRGVNLEELGSLARQTARHLSSIRDHRTGPWRQKADAARQAALGLALAAESSAPDAVRLQARKLGMACADCHGTYRSW